LKIIKMNNEVNIELETDLVNTLYMELNLAFAEYHANPELWIKTHPNNRIPIEYSYQDIVNSTQSAKYQNWLRKRLEPKFVYGSQDSGVDYPEYSQLEKQEKLDRLRERAREAKQYHKQLTNF